MVTAGVGSGPAGSVRDSATKVYSCGALPGAVPYWLSDRATRCWRLTGGSSPTVTSTVSGTFPGAAVTAVMVGCTTTGTTLDSTAARASVGAPTSRVRM